MIDTGSAELIRALPLWGSFIVLIGILVRQIIPWRKLSLDAAAQIREELKTRLNEVKEEHRQCLLDMKALQNEIAGMRRQHVQEQISLINAIISSVDSPNLKGLLRSLESVQVALSREVLQSQVGTVIRKGEQDAERA